MKFPVDLLADVSQVELEESACNYMNDLLYSSPDSPEHLILSDSTRVSIDLSRVGYVPLYGCSDKQRILALFSPTDPLTAVALYLLDRWWTVEDVLKTADPDRDGAVQVETFGERIVLYILNRVIYRAQEMNCEEELPFLCHGKKDYAKICWNNGEAVGFYSAKPSGSLCSSFSTRSYQLPVMDSMFVRRRHRGKGFGLLMLEDFVLSFPEDCLGLRYPLTKAMYKVCKKYLCQCPGETNLLWEVESVGGPNQRCNIASKIQTIDLSAITKKLSFPEEPRGGSAAAEQDGVTEAGVLRSTVEYTVEIVEEVTVRRAIKEAGGVPAAQSRSSGSKQGKTGDEITEDKKDLRIEDIEAETEQKKTEAVNVCELVQTEGLVSAEPGEAEEVASTVLASPRLEGAEGAGEPGPEEPQGIEEGTPDLNNTSCESHGTIENRAEIEEADEESQQDDTAALVYEEAEARNQAEVSKEDSEDILTEHQLSLTSQASSEGVNVRKTRAEPSKASRRKSQRHRKPEESEEEEPTAEAGRRVLRGRTVENSRYHIHREEECEELDSEIDEVAEEKEDPPTEETTGAGLEEAEETDAGGELTQDTLQQATHEHEEIGEEDGGRELPDAEENLPEDEVTAVVMRGVEGSDEEGDEPPVVSLRGRRKVTPKPTNHKKKDQQQEDKHTEETDPGTEGSDQGSDEQEQEHGQMLTQPGEELQAVEEGGGQRPGEEEVLTLPEVNLEERKEELEEETTTEVEETVVEVEEDEAEVKIVPLERNPDKDQTVTPAAEDPQEKDMEIIKLQKAAIISVIETEEAPEPEDLVVETEEAGSQENITATTTAAADHPGQEITNVEEAELEEEELPVTERVLRSGRKTVEASRRSTNRSKQKKEEDTTEEPPEKEVKETGADSDDVEGEIEAKEESSESFTGTHGSGEEHKDTEEPKVEVEKVDPGAGGVGQGALEEGTVGLAGAAIQEGETDSKQTKLAPCPPPLVSEEEVTPPLSDLQRVTVVLVDLRKTYHKAEEKPEVVDEHTPAHVAPEANLEQPDVPDEGLVGRSDPNEADIPDGHAADEGKILDDIPEEVIPTQYTVEQEQTCSTSGSVESTAGGSVQETMLTENEAKRVSEDEAPAAGRRSGGKAVMVRTRSKSTRIQASGIKGTDEDEPTATARGLKRGRRSAAAATPRRTSKRTRTQRQTGEEGEDETSNEEIQEEQTHSMIEEVQDTDEDRTNGEKDEEEHVIQGEEETEPGVEIEEGETLEEDQSAAAETSTEEQEDTPVEDRAGETPTAEEGAGTRAEQIPVVEPRSLRSDGKRVKVPPKAKTSKSQQDENADDVTSGERSADTDESAGSRVLRKGRRSGPVSPRRQSKRGRKQLLTEDEEEESVAAAEAEGEEGQESSEENVEDTEVARRGVQGKEEEAEEEETPVIEKGTTTVDMEPANMIVEDEALAEDASVEAEQEAPAIITRTLRSKTKTFYSTTSRRGNKDQGGAEGEDTQLSGGETLEVIHLNEESAEQREELNAKEQVEEIKVAINKEEEDEGELEETKDDREAECSDHEQEGKLDDSAEEDLKAIESTNEKDDIQKGILDTDEEAAETHTDQEHEEDEQNMSEEEVEQIVIRKKVLRGRSVPSMIITPHSKSRGHTAEDPTAGDTSDEESDKRRQSARRRSLRVKRKVIEVTPTRKSKRHRNV